MKGRRLTIVLVMLLVLICALAFVGCQEKKPNEPVTPQQPEHTHVAFLVEAKEATCTEEGNNAYYLCTCGLAFKDEAMTIPTYAYSEVIAKKDHVYNKTEVSREALKEAATCQSAAVYYYSCTCGAIDNGENANTFVFGEKAAHNTVYVPAVDATCETAGNIAYYTCGSCGIAFKDAEATQQFSVTETVVVPAEGHVTTAHERVEPTCTEAGVAAYWSCNVCGKMFSDAGCTNVITTANRAIPKLGHEYSEQLPLAQYKATDATCSAVATYYCSCVRCGEAGTATFGYGEKAPHTPEAVAAVAPTCTSDGNIEYYSCKVCAALFTDPACTTEVAYSDVVIAKLGHVYNQEVATSAYLKTPATCLSQAVYFKSCICGNFSEDTFTAGDYGAHVMTEAGYHASVAPDCEKDGSIAYFTCSVCSKDCTLDGKEIKNAADKVVAALGHDYAEIADADNLVSVATCTSPAIYKKVCTRCDQVGTERFSYGEKLAHSFEAWTERKESDCVNDGNVRYRHCATCNKNYDEFETEIVNVVIDKLGHDFNGKVVEDRYLATAATCTAPAQYYRSCTRCEMSSKEDSTLTAQLLFEVGDALGHNLGTIIAKVDADCLNDGLMAHYECERCSVYFNEEKTEVKLADIIIEKLGHDFSGQVAAEGYFVSAATCVDPAVYHLSCVRCALASDETFEYGTALGHTYGELIPRVNADCENDGAEAHYVCSVCSVWFDAEKVETAKENLILTKLGHDYTRQVVDVIYLKSVATCTSPAIYYCSCIKCNSSSYGSEYEQTFEIGTSAPHVFGDWTLEKDPTCTEDGNIKYRSCSTCSQYFDINDAVVTNVVVAKLGHDFTAQVAEAAYLVSAADCVNEAVYYCSCSRCKLAGEETFKYGTALGHSYGTLIAKVDADCLNDGLDAHYICSACSVWFDAEKVETTAEALVIAKLGHDFTAQVVDAMYFVSSANCVEAAKYYCSCTRCTLAGTETFEVGSALGHSYGTLVAKVEADCLNDGLDAHYICSVCSVWFDAEKVETTAEALVITKLGHDFTAQVVDSKYLASSANCTEAAKYYCSCTRCTIAGTETFEVGSAFGHSYGTIIAKVDADCLNDGLEAHYICSVCSVWFTAGKEATTQAELVIEKLGHDFTAQVVDSKYIASPANCTEAAKYYCSCSRCAVVGTETFEVGSAFGHTYGTIIAKVDADCLNDGLDAHYICSVCSVWFDAEKVETTAEALVITKLGHDFTAQVVDSKYFASPANCTEAAKYYCACTRCKVAGTETFEIGNALGHTYGELVAKVDSTCTATGLEAHYVCSACSVWFDAEKVETTAEALVIEKTPHDFSVRSETVAVPATCTEAALYFCSCSVCSLISDDLANTVAYGDPKGHVYGELIAKVDADCENDGLDAHYVCADCSVWFTAEKVATTQEALVIKTSGHNYGTLIEGVPATCLKEGNISYYNCSVCSKYFDENKTEVTSIVIEKLTHDYTRQVVKDIYLKTPATCVAPAVYYYSCYHCDSSSVGTEFENTFEAGITAPHVYGEWVSRVEPTCTTDGNVKYRYCSVCEKNYDEAEVAVADVTIAQLGHDFTAQVADAKYLASAANCEDPAEYYCSCTRCELAGTETFESGEALGHTYGELIARVEPTYVTEGTIAHYTCSACAKNFDESKKEVNDLSVPRTLPTAGVGTYDETGKYLPGQYVVSGSGESAVYGDLPYAVERKNGAYVISGRLIYDANTKNYPYVIRFDADFATYYSKVADNTVILKYAYADGTVYATFTKADAFANDFSFIFKGDALKGDAQCLFLDPTVATEDWIVYQISIGSDVVCPKEVPAAEATYWYNGWNTYYIDMLREGKYFADIDCKTELTAEQVFVKEKLSISGMTAGINAQVGVDAEENPVYGFTTSSAYSVVMVNGVYTVVGNIACNNDRSDVSSVKLVVRIDGNFKQFYRVIAHETVIVRLTVGENVVEITKGNTYFTEDGAIVIIFALEKGQTLTVDVLNPLTEKFDALTYTIVVDDGATYVHNMEVRNAIPATYWSEGCTEYVECADCGKQVGYKVVEKLVPTMTPILSDEAHVYTVSYKDGKYVISGNPKFELPEGNLEAGYRVKIKFGCEFGNAYAGFADTDVIIVVNVGGTEYKITKADLDEDGGFTLTLNVTEEMEFSITFINPDEEGENAVYSFIVKGITNA